MIRVNLLPQAKKAVHAVPGASGTAQGWAIAYLIFSILWGIGLAGVYLTFSSDLDQQRQANGVLSTQIEQLRTKSAQLEEVQAKVQASRNLEDLVRDLNRARLGPARVLMELSKILSAEGGPTIDPQALERLRLDNPLAGFNRAWDPQRLWLTKFEEENRECKIFGSGKTNEDVAEFHRRLGLSEVFEAVNLERTQSAADADTGLTFIGFEFSCRVRY